MALNDASLDDINNPDVWKVVFTSEELKPGEWSTTGNNLANYNGLHKNGAFVITDEIAKAAGFTDEQMKGKYVFNWLLLNNNDEGQKPVDYYYAPQGQVRVNYVTSDGTVIQSPVTAYENSSNNTAYDVSGSTYKPETITVNGKTYRYVKSDKALSKGGTAEVNGYTYNVTPSDETGRIKSNTVNDVFYVYEQVKYHTEAETKDVTRTIEYYDSVTGEAIPSSLEPTVTQTAKLNRNKIYDDQNNFIGYGTISADRSSYTIDNSWTVDAQTWTQQDSADLSDYGYTAPDRASVAAVTVDGNTTDVTEKVYYGHQTTPVTPTDPKTPGKPINPKGDVPYPDGVSKDDLTSTVKRTINYVDEDGNAVNGSPDGTSSYEQTAEFTRTAIIDKVTGKILGYDTNNDGKVDTESADRAWQPTSKTLEAVKSADPSSVGYDNVDISNVSSLVVTPGQGDTTVTVTYSNNQVSGTIKYIDDTTGVELDSDTLPTGKVGSTINYTTADKIKSYEDQGYELVSSDFTDGSQVYKKTGNDFVVHLKHKTQTITPNDPNPVTPGEPINPNDPNSPVYGEETDRKNLVKDASQTIHYVGAGDKTPADNVVTQKDAFTRTVTIDKVTGKVLSYTDWEGEKTFNTVDTPVVDGYHADKKVAGGLTATADNPDVEETVTYSPNGKIVPVDPNNTPIPGADTPTYPTDPNDPTKVVPNEPIPDVPGWNPVDPSPVTPEDPGKDTPVVYTQAKYGLTEKFVDENGNDLVPSVSKGTDYKSGDKYDVTKDAKVITGYVLVKTTDTTGTFTDGNKTAVFTYKKMGKIVPVDPNGNPIPGADTPTYKNDPDDPSKVVPNEPTPTVPGYKTNVPNVTPEDPTKDTPVPYTKNETPAAKYGLTEKFVDENGNELVPSESKGTDYKSGDKYDVTKDAKVITGYVLVKTEDTTGTFTDGNKTAVFTYKKMGKIVPVDPNGNPIPGADTPTYKNDPDDPSKVVPNEPTPTVPGYKTNVPNVTPEDPTKDTPVPYTKNETPAAKYGLTEKFVDENGNELVPSESKGTDYKSGDKYDVTKDAKVITGYVLVKTEDTTGTFTDGNKTAVFTYKKLGKIVPVDPNGNPIPGADTPTYKNDPDDPSKVTPNEPTPSVPGYKTDVPNVTPEDPTKDTPVVYTKKTTPETPAAKYGLTEKFVDENGNELVPSESKGTDYKSGDKYDVTKDAKVITGYVLVKTTDTTGTFGDSDKTAVFTYKKIGKIIPVDKDGNPIPGAETPSYKNDPSDPSKVLPNEPTPDVLGYKTDVPSVTPEDPTKDTPVPYTKSVTPSKPSNNKPGKKGAPSAPTGPTSPTLPGGKKGKTAPATPNATAFSTGSSKQTASLKQNAQAKLPQTGEATDKSRALSVLGLGVIALTALLGLAIDKKRKN
ncbi:mucin-binding protein [Lactobacillus delbrueckii]|uniref:mucin-binding protein n=3 Tax=Lactobacillus delbrueckii TaxID=1584 RepID=UPI0022E24AC0|nr:MucBP domain-containing protein [Lactobacillus delbrueckii]